MKIAIRYQHANHLIVLQPEQRDKALRRAVKILKAVEFDTIAFTGVSGGIFAPLLALRLKKELLVVRKKQDTDNHSFERKVEGYFHAQKYLFVDDLISSGKTAARVHRVIKEEIPEATCIGFYGYVEGTFDAKIRLGYDQDRLVWEHPKDQPDKSSEPITSSIEEPNSDFVVTVKSGVVSYRSYVDPSGTLITDREDIPF